MPLFDYQKLIYDASQSAKYVWIKKAAAIGGTETLLRYFTWLACKDNNLRGTTICFVTGPGEELTITLIKRIKELFTNAIEGLRFEELQTIATINGVNFEAFPSNHLDSMRGLTRVSAIVLDEADFFAIHEQQNCRHIAERYIAKSDP
jgi:hypothetical protein